MRRCAMLEATIRKCVIARRSAETLAGAYVRDKAWS